MPDGATEVPAKVMAESPAEAPGRPEVDDEPAAWWDQVDRLYSDWRADPERFMRPAGNEQAHWYEFRRDARYSRPDPRYVQARELADRYPEGHAGRAGRAPGGRRGGHPGGWPGHL